MSDSPKIAVFVAPGLEEIEGLTVVDLVRRAKIACDVVAITEDRTVSGSHGITIVCDRSIADADFDFNAYDMLVLPGGIPGTPNLAACAPLTEALAAFAAAGKMICAICAAPTVFAGLGLLRGRTATCYPSMTDQLVEGGATLGEGPVVIDGNIITSRGMGTAIDFGLALVAHYAGVEAAETLGQGIVYQQ